MGEHSLPLLRDSLQSRFSGTLPGNPYPAGKGVSPPIRLFSFPPSCESDTVLRARRMPFHACLDRLSIFPYAEDGSRRRTTYFLPPLTRCIDRWSFPYPAFRHMAYELLVLFIAKQTLTGGFPCANCFTGCVQPCCFWLACPKSGTPPIPSR